MALFVVVVAAAYCCGDHARLPIIWPCAYDAE
jgi:hypothetical protein